MQITHTQTGRNRNKIEIQKICPDIPKNELDISNQKCILGISINSPSSSGNKIAAIFDFLIKRGLNKINVLFADSLYRYTAMIKHHCNEEEGRIIGKEKSKQLTETYSALINNESTPYPLEFIYSSFIADNEQFNILYQKIWELFETHSLFRQSILNFSNYYLNRVFDFSISTEIDYSQFAYKYVIEELVIIAILNQQGFKTILYPGVVKDIFDIISIKHPYLSLLFNECTFVSLRIKRKT